MHTLENVVVSSNPSQIKNSAMLDNANDQLEEGRIAPALDALFEDLRSRRDEEPDIWPSYAKTCLDHSIRDLLHQDPFTYRAYSKPRGYAGDAVMMDYIYGLGEARKAARDTTPLGRAIFQYMDTRPSARAVRYRRQLIARLIDRVVDGGGSSVLAIAAGHLREVERSIAVQTGRVKNFVALDQDEASLAVIANDYAYLGIQTMEGSVRQILSGKIKPGNFDFVYAAGLFDYLNAHVAAALTCRMFEMTRPGGLMLIPNFLTSVRDIGYMEAFMDWHLIYREHADMHELVAALPPNSVADWQIFDDEDESITFLQVSKRTTF